MTNPKTVTYKTTRASGSPEFQRLLHQSGSRGSMPGKTMSDFERLLHKGDLVNDTKKLTRHSTNKVKAKSELDRLLKGDVTPRKQAGKSYPNYVGTTKPKTPSPWVKAKPSITQQKLSQLPRRLQGTALVVAQDTAQAANRSRALMDDVISAGIKALVDQFIDDAIDAPQPELMPLNSFRVGKPGTANTFNVWRTTGGSYKFKGVNKFDNTPDGSFSFASQTAFNNFSAFFYPNGASEQEIYASQVERVTSAILRYFPTLVYKAPEPITIKQRMHEEDPQTKRQARKALYNLAIKPAASSKHKSFTIVGTWPGLSGGGKGRDVHFGPSRFSGRYPKHDKSHAQKQFFNLANGALDWVSELGEAWGLIKEAAGFSAGADNLEVLQYLADGGWRELDHAALARDLALNIILDKILGPMLGYMGKTIRSNPGGPSTSTQQYLSIF